MKLLLAVMFGSLFIWLIQAAYTKLCFSVERLKASHSKFADCSTCCNSDKYNYIKDYEICDICIKSYQESNKMCNYRYDYTGRNTPYIYRHSWLHKIKRKLFKYLHNV